MRTLGSLDSIYKALNDAVSKAKKEGLEKITIYVMFDNIYVELEQLPQAFFRGRWLYIDYKGVEIAVRKHRTLFKAPRGTNTIELEKECGKLMKTNPFAPSKPIKISAYDKGIRRRLKYTIEKVVAESDAVEYSFEGCNGIKNLKNIDRNDEVGMNAVIRCFNKEDKDVYTTQYDYDYPITFFKKQGNNYIAWIQFINERWELL